MILGLDYHDTISSYPDHFRFLARSVLAEGGQVHIISACSEANANKYGKQIMRAKVPNTSIHMVVYEQHYQAPKLKLNLAKELGVTLMIDDRADTCALFAAHGIAALRVFNFGDKV